LAKPYFSSAWRQRGQVSGQLRIFSQHISDVSYPGNQGLTQMFSEGLVAALIQLLCPGLSKGRCWFAASLFLIFIAIPCIKSLSFYYLYTFDFMPKQPIC